MGGVINNKNIGWIISAAVIIIAAVITLFYMDETRFKRISLEEYKSPENIQFSLDACNKQDGRYVINGWAVYLGEDTAQFKTKVALKKLDTSECYVINTQVNGRDDVTDMFNDGHDYGASGYYANFKASKLESGARYEIYILLDNEHGKFAIPTGYILE